MVKISCADWENFLNCFLTLSLKIDESSYKNKLNISKYI